MKVKVLVAHLYLTLCDPMDSPVPDIFQARILEWVSSALLQGNLPDPGIKSRSPPLQADSLPSEPPIDGETMVTVKDFISWAPKLLQMVTAAMKLKHAYSLEGKL